MPGEVFDGFVELRDGMNGSRHPSLLTETQYARGVNVVCRGGLVKTRPAFVEENVPLASGTFQGAGRWSLNSGDRLVFVISGHLYSMPVDTLAVTDHGLKLDTAAQCFFEQVDRYLMVQDGTSTPVVLGEVAGAAQLYTGTISLPAGYMMVFAQGRLHMVPKLVPSTSVDGRAYLISGDILLPSDPGNVFKYLEGEYLAEGGAHGLPLELGFIGGLGVLRNSQTGTGVGQVMVFARNGVCAFDFISDRDLWKTQALSQVQFFGSGCQSPWSVVNVNDDLMYRSDDGIRSLRYTASQVAAGSGALSNTPMSIEVGELLISDRPYLRRVSAGFADNRLFVTAGGKSGNAYQGLISWDTAAVYLNGARRQPVYDGVWTGTDFLQTLSALRGGTMVEFAFGVGPKLYRIDDSVYLDPDDTPIEASVITRNFPFGDIITRKRLQYAELWLSELRHDVTVEIWYRPLGYPLWSRMGSRSIKVASGGYPQARRRMKIPLDISSQVCDPSSDEVLWTGTEFQFMIKWTGYARIDRFRASAEPLYEEPDDACEVEESVAIVPSATAGQDLDSPYTYSF